MTRGWRDGEDPRKEERGDGAVVEISDGEIGSCDGKNREARGEILGERTLGGKRKKMGEMQ